MTLLRQRQQKLIISISLGCWLFAFFLGVVNACEVAGALTASHHAATHDHDHDDSAPNDCEHFCNNNTPVSAKTKSFQGHGFEQPPLIVSTLLAPFVAGAKQDVLLLDHQDPPPPFARYALFLRLAL